MDLSPLPLGFACGPEQGVSTKSQFKKRAKQEYLFWKDTKEVVTILIVLQPSAFSRLFGLKFS